tara:strand:+ start:194 stop:1288 length:1095 start_codon:yes stop_codon:yes gene_type:complete
MKISIFIADEGYGHAMRQKNIIHELLDHIPFVQITVFGKDKLDLISDEFKEALNYIDIFSLMVTVKDDLGNLDIKNTQESFKQWSNNKDDWCSKVIKYIDPKTDLIISDSVPQVSRVAKELNIKLLNIQHFTWDWLYLKLYEEDGIFKELNYCYKDWGQFVFPPLTPIDNLKMYPNFIPIDFIVNRRLIRQTKSYLGKKGNFRNILLMNNGTNSLSTVIEKIIKELPPNKNWNILLRSDCLSENIKEIAFRRNDVKIINGLNNVHLSIANADLIVARGGYNIVSEILALNKQSLIIEERNNPEVISNLELIKSFKSMTLSTKENALSSLKKLIQRENENRSINHSEKLSSLGACQVVLKIFNYL